MVRAVACVVLVIELEDIADDGVVHEPACGVVELRVRRHRLVRRVRQEWRFQLLQQGELLVEACLAGVTEVVVLENVEAVGLHRRSEGLELAPEERRTAHRAVEREERWHVAASAQFETDDRADMRRLGFERGVRRVRRLQVELSPLVSRLPALDRAKDAHVGGMGRELREQRRVQDNAAGELLQIGVAGVPAGVLDIKCVEVARRAVHVDEYALPRRGARLHFEHLHLGVAPPRQRVQRGPGPEAAEPFAASGFGALIAAVHRWPHLAISVVKQKLRLVQERPLQIRQPDLTVAPVRRE